MRGLGRALVMAASAIILAGCGESKGCTLIGCINSASAHLAPESGVWTAGEYELTIVRDQATSSCRFAAPADLPRGDVVLKNLDCGPQMSAELWADTECTTTRTAEAVSHSCTPIPDHYYLALRMEDAPQKVSLELARDGEVVANDSRSPDYRLFSPNGSECGGGCQQASYDVVVAP